MYLCQVYFFTLVVDLFFLMLSHEEAHVNFHVKGNLERNVFMPSIFVYFSCWSFLSDALPGRSTCEFSCFSKVSIGWWPIPSWKWICTFQDFWYHQGEGGMLSNHILILPSVILKLRDNNVAESSAFVGMMIKRSFPYPIILSKATRVRTNLSLDVLL